MRPISITVLDNGLYLYTRYDSGSPLCFCGIGVSTGSIDGPIEYPGLAHLAEHVIFRETKKYLLISVIETVEKFGGFENLAVQTDRTSTFFGWPPFKKRYLDKNFDILTDLIRHPIINKTAASTEKAAVHREILKFKDIPEEAIETLLYQQLYPGHPLGAPIEGSPVGVKAIPWSLLVDFFRKYYVPNNMAVIIFGPKYQEALNLTKECFKNFESKSLLSRNPIPLPKWSGKKELVLQKPGLCQSYLLMGFPVGNFFSKDRAALEILTRILSVRLWLKLREANRDFDKGVYRTTAELDTSFLHGILKIKLAVNRDFETEAKTEILNECQRLKNELVEKEIFEVAIKNLSNAHDEVLTENSQDLAELTLKHFSNGDKNLRLLQGQKQGDGKYAGGYKNELAEVGRKKIMAVAKKYLNQHRHATVTLKSPD